jgi:hypothetical protein
MMTQVLSPAPPAPLPPVEQLPVIVDTGVPWHEVAPALVMSVLLVGAVFLLLPIVRAWARRIEGRGADPVVADELLQMRDRIAELDSISMRVHELEERLDFAERLLVQRDAQALPPHDAERR